MQLNSKRNDFIDLNIIKENLLKTAWQKGLRAVNGRYAVSKKMGEQDLTGHNVVLAIGKAAASMCLGALDVLGNDTSALVVTKYGHANEELEQYSNISVQEAGHPIPDENSLIAGSKVHKFVKAVGGDTRLILLISGGASSLAEVLPHGVSLEDLRKFNKAKIASGATIEQINEERIKLSRIKGGKLLSNFVGREVLCYLISDVPNGSEDKIGSGLSEVNIKRTFFPLPKSPKVYKTVVARNLDARNAISHWVESIDIPVVTNSETLFGDIYTEAENISKKIIDGPNGFYIWGGEPTVVLPENPGEGGRNQSLALALAKCLKGHDAISCLVAGTDGTDGPTDAAGGIINATSFSPEREAQLALDSANASPFLRSKDNLFVTGPTGTNVMDLVIATKLSPHELENIQRIL